MVIAHKITVPFAMTLSTGPDVRHACCHRMHLLRNVGRFKVLWCNNFICSSYALFFITCILPRHTHLPNSPRLMPPLSIVNALNILSRQPGLTCDHNKASTLPQHVAGTIRHQTQLPTSTHSLTAIGFVAGLSVCDSTCMLRKHFETVPFFACVFTKINHHDAEPWIGQATGRAL
jgi:hypothetical protein